jgi:hypothetical protein
MLLTRHVGLKRSVEIIATLLSQSLIPAPTALTAMPRPLQTVVSSCVPSYVQAGSTTPVKPPHMMLAIACTALSFCPLFPLKSFE